jgi:hypothetical protein
VKCLSVTGLVVAGSIHGTRYVEILLPFLP